MTESSVTLNEKLPLLLLIEDSNEDFEALQCYVRKSELKISIYRCIDGDEALTFLSRRDRFADSQSLPHPALVVLDLNLPRMDGREILGRIKQEENLKLTPVVILTTSNNLKDIEACYRQGVNSYIKPMDFNKLRHNIESLIDYWFNTTILPTAVLESN